MRIILTSGTGLLGGYITRLLLSKGHEVTILTRRFSKVGSQGAPTYVQWDASTPKGWEGVLEEADALVHLTGENLGSSRWTAGRKRRILESRVRAGRAITQAFLQANHRPQVLLQSSAVGYYGPTGDQVLSESSPPGGDFLARVCVDWEASTRGVEEVGVRRVVTRSGLVLTPKSSIMARILLPYRLFVGGPFGSARQWWPWIHVRDEVNAMLFLLENPHASGPYNLAAPNPVRMSEFGRTLARIIRRPYLVPAPAFFLRLLLGEMSTLVLDGQRALPTRLQEAGYPFEFETLEAALQDLLRSPGRASVGKTAVQ